MHEKMDNTFIDNAEDLDIFMPMYNLLGYSENYSMTSGSLWNYHRDEVNDDANENNNDDYRINNNNTTTSKSFEYNANENNNDDYRINNSNTTTSKSFEYKTKIIGSTPADNCRLDVELVVPLNHSSNFWRSLDLHLINCKIKFDLRWARNGIISEVPTAAVVVGSNTAPPTTTTSVKFQINNA